MSHAECLISNLWPNGSYKWNTLQNNMVILDIFNMKIVATYKITKWYAHKGKKYMKTKPKSQEKKAKKTKMN